MRYLRCGGIWLGPGKAVLPSSIISISDDIITDIRPSSDVQSELFVIPSFVDAHCHFTWSGLERVFFDLSDAVSASDLLALISSVIDSDDTGRILRGFGFDENCWNNPELPSLSELDRVTGKRPVFFSRVCLHKAIVNSAMLEMLPAESSGVNYETGVIKEGIIYDFLTLFPPERHILNQAFSHATELAWSSGVTAAFTFEPLLTSALLVKHKSPLRMSIGLFGMDAGFQGEIHGDLREILPHMSGLKFFLDGSLGASTAAVSGTYSSGTAVKPMLSDDQVMASLEFADRLGLMPVYHAIGGRALEQIDRVSCKYISRRQNNDKHIRIRIEHAEELTADWPGHWNPAVHSFVMQPNFVKRWQTRGGLYEAKLGRDRALAMNPFRLVLDAGFPLGFSSDGMPFGPLNGLDGATEHPTERFRLDTASALNAYTLEAASICGFKDLSKPLARGRIADITVLSGNPFNTSWDEIKVIATISAGETVYGLEELQED